MATVAQIKNLKPVLEDLMIQHNGGVPEWLRKKN